MKKDAIISECGKYRYLLSRVWDNELETLVFIMLNPSIADANIDDPTIRRCIQFAKDNNYGAVKVVNLFAYRATKPEDLFATSDCVGDLNDDYLLETVQEDSTTIIAAWGVNGNFLSRDKEVINIVTKFKPIYCLGLTNGGHPRHPLYVAKNTPITLYKDI